MLQINDTYEYTDCPNKNANLTFGINNFQNYKSINQYALGFEMITKSLHFAENPSDLVQ